MPSLKCDDCHQALADGRGRGFHPLKSMETLLIHPADDMVVALTDLRAGQIVTVGGLQLALTSDVCSKHKIYLRDLPRGAQPRLYGMPVGQTKLAVKAGDPVSSENLRSLSSTHESRPMGELRWQPPEADLLPSTFRGYYRPDGFVGTRNHILVAYTVACAQHVAQKLVAFHRAALGFAENRCGTTTNGPEACCFEKQMDNDAGVDDIVLLHHNSGCGMADEKEPETLIQYIAGHVLHPNVAGAIVVGLGCEKTPIQRVRAHVGETWKPVVYLSHQASGTEDALLHSASNALKQMLPEAARHCRQAMPVSSLTIGLQCGGSDGFSGLTANPALGRVSDLVVGMGGRVMLPETPEMCGGEAILTGRATDGEVAEDILNLVQGFRDYAGRFDLEIGENLSCGNVRGGLTTIEMKALGAIQKAGSAPVSGVLEYCQSTPGPGLYLVDTPGYDPASTSALTASGANLIMFTTGSGTPMGNPLAPVIKISSNSETANRMSDIVDFDAGGILKGATVDDIGRNLYHLALRVASGARTKNEFLGHRESCFWRRYPML